MIRRPPRSTLLSLHDALPISQQRDHERRSRHHADLASDDRPHELALVALAERRHGLAALQAAPVELGLRRDYSQLLDRKSTRLNSSHSQISYAVFCLKKKKKK